MAALCTQAERDAAQSKAQQAESQVAELQQQLEAQQAAAAAYAEAAEQAQTLKQVSMSPNGFTAIAQLEQYSIHNLLLLSRTALNA